VYIIHKTNAGIGQIPNDYNNTRYRYLVYLHSTYLNLKYDSQFIIYHINKNSNTVTPYLYMDN